MMEKYEFDVYEFRPEGIFSGGLMRYNNGNWIEDDGEYDIAFVCLEEQSYAYISLPYRKNLQWSWCKNMNWGAYVHKHPNGNAWHYMSKDGEKDILDSWDRDDHPNTKAGKVAGNYCADIKGCANGRGIQMNMSDKSIEIGLVRNVKTKDVLVFPKIFTCIYCGNHDWKQEELPKP